MGSEILEVTSRLIVPNLYEARFSNASQDGSVGGVLLLFVAFGLQKSRPISPRNSCVHYTWR
jgi:hypothetical protein